MASTKTRHIYESVGDVRGGGQPSSERYMNIINIVFAVVAILLSLTGVCVYQMYDPDSRLEPGLSTSTTGDQMTFNVCVTCPSAAGNSPNILRLDMYDTGHKLKRCCATNTEELSALFRLVAEPSFKPPSKNFSISGASAHKLLIPSTYHPNLDVPKFLENQNVPLNLSLKLMPTIEHVRNVGVTTSGLELEHDGMYYVYSMVNFKPDSSQPCGRYERQIWKQNVIRKRPNNPQKSDVILTSQYTCTNESTGVSQSKHTGGTFFLLHGDKLSVEVSAYGLVNFNPGYSYLGLWMVGQGVW